MDDQQKHLRALEQAQDWPGLARAYYQMGCAAMDQGDLNRAILWLHRADTIYSAQDETYDAVGDQLIDDCSDRIGQLEQAPLLYNQVPASIEQAAEQLDDLLIRLWGLFSISRLNPLMKELSQLPGCQVLKELPWVTDLVFRSLQAPIAKDQADLLLYTCNTLYELTDSPVFYGGERISLPQGPDFEVFDLNGLLGTYLEITNYLDNHLRWLQAPPGQGPAAETGAVSCSLLLDYYVRTGSQPPDQIPQVQAELNRIWEDYRFLRSGPIWAQVRQRMTEYQK